MFSKKPPTAREVLETHIIGLTGKFREAKNFTGDVQQLAEGLLRQDGEKKLAAVTAAITKALSKTDDLPGVAKDTALTTEDNVTGVNLDLSVILAAAVAGKTASLPEALQRDNVTFERTFNFVRPGAAEEFDSATTLESLAAIKGRDVGRVTEGTARLALVVTESGKIQCHDYAEIISEGVFDNKTTSLEADKIEDLYPVIEGWLEKVAGEPAAARFKQEVAQRGWAQRVAAGFGKIQRHKRHGGPSGQ